MPKFYRIQDHLSIPPVKFLGDGAQRRSVTERGICFSHLGRDICKLSITLSKGGSWAQTWGRLLALVATMANTTIRSIRLRNDQDSQLERLMAVTGKSRNYLIRQAIANLIDAASQKGASAS